MSEPPAVEMTGLSDVGRVRDHNEDAIRWDANAGWAILADGMGGHLAGEVASEMAIETIAGRLSALVSEDTRSAGEALREAISEANRAIYHRAQSDPHCHNMGTTVVAVVVRDGWLCCAHVGDSRLYRFNQGQLTLLSHDHSLVQEMVDEGMMSAEEAARSVHRHVITRALGLEAPVEADLLQVPVATDDLFLLCSDGLSDAVAGAEMERLLANGELSAVAQALVDAANAQGGEDNISLILLRVS
jgi:protein phosphatase